MKKMVTMIALVLIMVGCSEPVTKEKIQGVWKVTEFLMEEDGPMIDKLLKDLVEHMYYTFDAETVVMESMLNGDKSSNEGTWRLDEEESKLYLKFKDTPQVDGAEFQIQKFTGTEMVWGNEEGEKKLSMTRVEK